MKEEIKVELLKEIKKILNDVKNYKYKGIGELFKSLDKLEDDLEIFVNDLEMKFVEVEDEN